MSGVPMVLVGTERTEQVLALDNQLVDRCPVKSYSRLKQWTYGNDFRSFLKGYEQFCRFPNHHIFTIQILLSPFLKLFKIKVVGQI